GLNAEIWVCSAGYGFVRATSRLKPYAATFSPAHRDGIQVRSDRGANGSSGRQWWAQLASWQGPEAGVPRRIADLARATPFVPILVAASPVYLAAMEEDLNEAMNSLASKGLLSIFSAGANSSGCLATNLVPCDARLQGCLGGARLSLNVRSLRLA